MPDYLYRCWKIILYDSNRHIKKITKKKLDKINRRDGKRVCNEKKSGDGHLNKKDLSSLQFSSLFYSYYPLKNAMTPITGRMKAQYSILIQTGCVAGLLLPLHLFLYQ